MTNVRAGQAGFRACDQGLREGGNRSNDTEVAGSRPTALHQVTPRLRWERAELTPWPSSWVDPSLNHLGCLLPALQMAQGGGRQLEWPQRKIGALLWGVWPLDDLTLPPKETSHGESPDSPRVLCRRGRRCTSHR
jgi:hypothetical protein